MLITLRLTDAEGEALRKNAQQEGRSVEEVALAAIAAYVSVRTDRFEAAIEKVREEDAELLGRLSSDRMHPPHRSVGSTAALEGALEAQRETHHN